MQHEANYREVVDVDVEAGDELEAALRREGYHLTRRQLDELMEEREYARFKRFVDRYAREAGVEAALVAEGAELAYAAEREDKESAGEKKPSAKKSALPRKPAASKPAATVDEEEEDWR